MYLLNTLRILFVVVAILVGIGIQSAFPQQVPQEAWFPFLMAALASCMVAVEIVFQNKYLAGLVAVFFGLMLGLGSTYIVMLVLQKFVPDDYFKRFIEPLGQMISLFLCYLCVTIVFQTKDRLRLVIPYVAFSQHGRKRGGLVLDTSILVDGRIAMLGQTSLISEELVVPHFVINELQALADSSNTFKRARGRRGLDTLAKLQSNTRLALRLDETDFPEMHTVDAKLARLAKMLDANLFTSDHNLAKVARIEKVDVIALQDLVSAMRPIVSPGERLQVKVVRAGDEKDQGVGFLDDGTMIVVESARGLVGQETEVEILRLLTTHAGRMVFARIVQGSDSASFSGLESGHDEGPGHAKQPAATPESTARKSS